MNGKLFSLGCLIGVECTRRYRVFGWTKVDLTPNKHEIMFRSMNYLFFSELTYIDNDQYIKHYIRDFSPMKVVYNNTEVDLDYTFGIFDDDSVYIRKNIT